MKRIVVAVLCALMVFSTVMPAVTPVTALAKSKCSHKKTEWVTTTNPTCYSTGVKTRECAKCGKKFETKRLPKTSHKFTVFSTWKATCTDSGYVTECCNICGDMRTRKVGKPLGHHWTKWKKSLFTGKYSRHCTRCDQKQTK